MFGINLIRDKSILPELKRNIRHNFIIVGAVCGLILVLILVGFISMYSKVSRYKKERKAVLKKIDAIVDNHNIKEWGIEWSGIYSDLKLISGVYDERTAWMVKLQELSRLLPEKMCISRINMDVNKKDIELKIIALEEESGEFDTVKKFLEDIDKSPVFKTGVKLIKQQRSNIKKTPVKIISILIQL